MEVPGRESLKRKDLSGTDFTSSWNVNMMPEKAATSHSDHEGFLLRLLKQDIGQCILGDDGCLSYQPRSVPL